MRTNSISARAAGRPVFQLEAPSLTLAVIAALTMSNEVRAQQQSGAAQEMEVISLEEIIVTARKRAENSQSVGAALTAFTAGDLNLIGALNPVSLAYSVPNMVIGNEKGDLKVMIRGVGSDNVQAFSDPGVAFHIDGVYQARPSGGNALFYDTERVEVLRGPQGTLYGRNATGGAVNVVSNLPTSEFEAHADLTAGNYNDFGQRAMLNVPLVQDVLSARFVATHETRDGFDENLRPDGTEGNDADDTTWRAQLLYTPSDRMRLVLRGNGSEKRGVGPSRKRVTPPPGNCQDCAYVQTPDELRAYYKDTDESIDSSVTAFSGTLEYDFDSSTLTVIGGTQRNSLDLLQDADDSLVSFGQPGGSTNVATIDQRSDQQTAEIRLASSSTGRFEWLIGGFYLSEDPQQRTVIDRLATNAPAVKIDVMHDVHTESNGLFGQISYALLDTLTGTVGARYSNDEKEALGGTINTIDPPGAAPPVSSGSQAYAIDDTWGETTWKAGLEWQVAPDHLLYANVSTGYKAGGFNFSTSVPGTYDPEQITAFEIGSKGRFNHGAVQFNTSAFYYDYTDLQVYQVVNQTVFTSNAEGAKVYGAEAELQMKPTRALQIDVTAAVLHAEYSNFTMTSNLFLDTAPGTPLPASFDAIENLPPYMRPGVAGQPLIFDLGGNQLVNAPRWSGRLGIQYTFDVLGGELIARAQSYAQADVYLRALNLEPYDMQEGYTKSDARLSYLHETWSLELFVENIEDDDVIANLEVTDSGVYLANLRPPRVYGVRIGVSF